MNLFSINFKDFELNLSGQGTAIMLPQLCKEINQFYQEFEKSINESNSTIFPIGEGGFGKIYVKDSNTLIKIMDIKYDHLLKMALKEVNIGFYFNEMKNDFISRSKNCYYEYNQTREIPLRLFIELEYYRGGDLSNFIANKKNLIIHYSPEWKYSISMCIIEGIISLTQMNIVHRDIKPQNIFLSDPFQAVIGDFGVAYILKNSEDRTREMGIGTLGYIPEEGKRGVLTPKHDIYSLGIVLFQVLNSANSIMDYLNPIMQIQNFCQSLNTIYPNIFDLEKNFYCQYFHPLILRMVDNDRKKRPNIEWIKEFFVLMKNQFKIATEYLINTLNSIKELNLMKNGNSFSLYKRMRRNLV